jgi:hypothetical protein
MPSASMNQQNEYDEEEDGMRSNNNNMGRREHKKT